MVLRKMVAFSIGNGAEIWPLEKGRKSPVLNMAFNQGLHGLLRYSKED